MTLGSQSQKAGNFASQVVAAIAAVELPQGQWPDLIEILLGFVNNQPNPNLKIATLQTIGFICETIVRLSILIVPKHYADSIPSRNLRSSACAPMRFLLP
jgi:hypothetical protein